MKACQGFSVMCEKLEVNTCSDLNLERLATRSIQQIDLSKGRARSLITKLEEVYISNTIQPATVTC